MKSVMSSSTTTINAKNAKFIDDVGCVPLNHNYQHEENKQQIHDEVDCVVLNHNYQREEHQIHDEVGCVVLNHNYQHDENKHQLFLKFEL